MPHSPPPSYVSQDPVVRYIRPSQINDSIPAARRRLRPEAILQDIQEVEQRPAVASPRAPAPLPPSPRVPDFIATVQAHHGIAAVNERPDHNGLVRLVRRMTVDSRLTPEQKADEVIGWLVRNGFMTRVSLERASQKVSMFYGHDTLTSKLFNSNGVCMKTNMPWLKDQHVQAIRTLLIDRVHASVADSKAAGASARSCLVRYFKLPETNKGLEPRKFVKVGKSGQELRCLSALHTDDVYFDEQKPLDNGAEGAFFAGITRKGYPVGIKRIENGTETEAKLMRTLTVGGYLQAHRGIPSTSPAIKAVPAWVVMPCYSGNLKQLAPMFFQVPSTPRINGAGGLIGARYMLRHIFGELAFLHGPMKGIHLDIKTTNIFVSQRQQRFVFGDYGLSNKLSAQGDSPYTGMTVGFGSPEQMQGRKLTVATDVFSLCVTAVTGLLQADPAFDQVWKRLHPYQTKPLMLFSHDESQLGNSFSAWFNFNEKGRATPHIDAMNDGTWLRDLTRAGHDFATDYKNIDAVMQELDGSLWRTLRSGLRQQPGDRSSAKSIQERITLTNAEETTCKAVWARMQPYSPVIAAEVSRLTSLVAGLGR